MTASQPELEDEAAKLPAPPMMDTVRGAGTEPPCEENDRDVGEMVKSDPELTTKVTAALTDPFADPAPATVTRPL